MGTFFHYVLYLPIYNLLMFLVDILPGGDLGLAVVILTIVVRLIILPLSISALRTSRGMQALQPKLKALQEEYKDDKEAQARETFALYKKYKLNPFASVLALFIQLPVIIMLYWVLRKNLTIDAAYLYSFVKAPAALSTQFLGIFPISGHVIILAVLAAFFQFLQAKYAMPTPPPPKDSQAAGDQFNRALALQAQFVFPVLIGWIAYVSSGAIALYFITTSIFTLAQELLLRRMPQIAVD